MRTPLPLLLAASALVATSAAPALANPLGSSIAAGSATVSGEGTTSVTVHQSTDKAIINWNTFDIGAGEATTFVQPGAGSVTLNRVTGGLGASAIDGTLSANGRIFLINPDGILFGTGATIDVGGLVATTSDIADGDFMAGRYVFGTPGRADASVVNAGTITAASGGFAVLVAPGVRNSGTIAARLGQVSLAAGNAFTLDFYGDRLITLAVGDEIAGKVTDLATGQPLDALVKNEGTLSANGGTVELTAAAARAVVDQVINTTGIVEANSVGTKGGKIVLGAATAGSKPAGAPTQKVKVSGTMSAAGKSTGETGGKVQITGETIEVVVATIDASGHAGGGTVLIGGDVGGGRATDAALPSILNATNVVVDDSSTIDASALSEGHGGKIVVWADQTTSFDGSLSARGGPAGGNGGFAEVSGKESLRYAGSADLSAPRGVAGTLLLDPRNVTIGSSGTWVVTPAAIEAALQNGVVIVSTNAPGSEAGDITVAESIHIGSNQLALVAHRNIVFLNGVNVTASEYNSNLNLLAGAAYLGGSDYRTTGAGTVVFDGASTLPGFTSIFYNPTSYANPTDFSPYFLPQIGQYVGIMWVNNVVDLQNMSQNLNGFYAIASNINAGGFAFTPIGTASDPFTGGLFGVPGSSIDNLTIVSSAAHVGLFGYFAGGKEFQGQLALNNASIVGTAPGAYVGGIAGWAGRAIERSYVTGTVTGTGTGATVGGLAGYGHAANSYSRASVSAPNGTAGGLLGEAGSVYSSYAAGPVSGATTGGLVGAGLPWVSNSYYDVSATGQVDSAGGFPATTAELKSGIPPEWDHWYWSIGPSINNGYPNLSWPTASDLGPATVLPEGSTVTPTKITYPTAQIRSYDLYQAELAAAAAAAEARSAPTLPSFNVGSVQTMTYTFVEEGNYVVIYQNGRRIKTLTFKEASDIYDYVPRGRSGHTSTITYRLETQGSGVVVYANGLKLRTTTVARVNQYFGSGTTQAPTAPAASAIVYYYSVPGAILTVTLDQILNGTFPPGTKFVQDGTLAVFTLEQLRPALATPVPVQRSTQVAANSVQSSAPQPEAATTGGLSQATLDKLRADTEALLANASTESVAPANAIEKAKSDVAAAARGEVPTLLVPAQDLQGTAYFLERNRIALQYVAASESVANLSAKTVTSLVVGGAAAAVVGLELKSRGASDQRVFFTSLVVGLVTAAAIDRLLTVEEARKGVADIMAGRTVDGIAGVGPLALDVLSVFYPPAQAAAVVGKLLGPATAYLYGFFAGVDLSS